MKLSFQRVSHSASLAGVVLLCGLTVVGCNKKQESTDKTEETDVEVVTTVPGVQCDDQVALNKLRQSIKSNLSSQTQNLFKSYVDNSNQKPSVSRAKNAVDSVLIDIANPAVIQEANAQGMVTCSASLSLTLPNSDIARANRVYTRSEGSSLSQVMRLKGIVLNNNMLVTDNFNYVVGMQGGQTTARVVGQPNLLTAAADIIAKSQFQAVIDANTTGQGSDRTRSGSVAPVKPIQPAEPNNRSNRNNNNDVNNRNREPSRPPQSQAEPRPRQESQVQQAPRPKPEATKPPETAPSVEPRPKNKPATEEPAQSIDELTVPEDDNIEMIIIEEEGTY